jgi:3-phenylpropionate/trans-cinnamate dioxygenase ferredoxin reductase subunit
MARKLSILANDLPFSAYPGELLLDAALNQGIDLPHDQLPAVRRFAGTLVDIDQLASDIRGVTIRLKDRANHRPGQYYRFKFRGYPARRFSPTSPFVGGDDRRTLRLHIKMMRDGEVSSKLETDIQPGHKISIEGPFGSAFYRPGNGRLLLVASGTGFAPIWAIAATSLRRRPNRPLLLIAGARRLSSLYMAPALCRLAAHPTAQFIATTDEAQTASEIVRWGSPAQHLPEICASDTVYAAGAPSLVETVGRAAAHAGAAFYANPFVASSRPEASWLSGRLPNLGVRELKSRVRGWFATSAQHERCDDLAPNLASAHFYPGTNDMHDRASASGGQTLW